MKKFSVITIYKILKQIFVCVFKNRNFLPLKL